MNQINALLFITISPGCGRDAAQSSSNRHAHQRRIAMAENNLNEIYFRVNNRTPGTREMANSNSLTQADYEALAEFRFQLRRFLRFSEEAAKSEGLRPLQYQLLLQVKGFPPPMLPAIGELSERLQMAQHNTVALVSRCEKAGLVRRVPGKIDRRRVGVKLTAAGQRTVRRVAALNRKELQTMSSVFRVTRLSVFNDEQRDGFEGSRN
jgi:DNA-binding MarR family transcriptional regulator